MVSLERLSSNNFKSFRKLNQERIDENSYDKNFFDYYNNEKFFFKIFLKKFVKLFIYNNEVIGYIWYEVPIEAPVRVWSLYIQPQYINLIEESTLNYFNNITLSYEAADNRFNNIMLNSFGFRKVNFSILMNIYIENYNKNKQINEIISYIEYNSYIINKFNKLYNDKINSLFLKIEKFRRNKDEELRCTLQNSIFSNSTRVPLEVQDIESDIIQEYYIDDLSLFLKINDIPVGYGQVIYNRNMYTVVNFGILQEFRGLGLGKILLNEIISLCKEKLIKELFIRVEEDNLQAIKLYKWIGFNNCSLIDRWER